MLGISFHYLNRVGRELQCLFFVVVPLIVLCRPVQWTSSSLIITAHGTEPRVVCLQFPSNKRFILPDPPGISASPTSYDSPSIIAASSRDDWIFAYFPGSDVDGIGCFWSKPRLVDDWVIREWRTFARGDSVVTARWLNSERQVRNLLNFAKVAFLNKSSITH